MKMKNVKLKIENAKLVSAKWGSGLLTACVKSALLFLILNSPFSILNSSAAVPLKWTVETSRATPAQFEAYQGETLALEASLQSYGKPVEMTGIAALYWQTNGMGSTYWEASAAVNSNRMSAVWTPEMDVGAKVYNCFIGVPGTVYHAAFQLRLRPSPGALPNVLPLPVPVIDFAKVRVLNPPWEGGGGGGVDGAARPLPKYLHALDYDDTYPDAAEEFYRTAAALSGGCSIVRKGNLVGGNFDYPYDDACSFAIKVSAASNRHASVGMAYVGTNLTESVVCSGKFSPLYRVLPGMTESGINDAGVYAKINVIPRDPTKDPAPGGTRDLHALAVVRYVLDHFDNTADAAEYVEAHYYIPETSADSYHWVIADVNGTYVVEDGVAQYMGGAPYALTNHRVMTSDTYGNGYERRSVLATQSTVESALSAARFTNAYADGWPWPDEFAGQTDAQGRIPHDATDRLKAWADAHVAPLLDANRKPSVRGNGCWQTVHSAVYDFASKTMRVSVQETDDWYTFALAKNGTDEAKVREIAEAVVAPVAARTGADITTGGGYTPFGYTDPANDISTNIQNLDGGIVESNERLDEFIDEAYDAFAQKEEAVANQDGEANDLTVNGMTVNYDATFNDNVYIGPNSLYLDGTLLEEVLGGYTPRGIFNSLNNDFETHKENTNIHVKVAEKASWNAKLSSSDVIDPASATTTGKAADALKVKVALSRLPNTVVSATPDFYRTGKDGEVGTGWAYTAIEGTGAKRFAAEFPHFDTTVVLTPADPDDPIVSAFGGRFHGAGLVREISFLGSASTPGRYDVAEADFSMTNGIPVVATVRRNILSPSPSLEGVRVTDTYTWLEFDTPDGVHHGCYGFYADGQTVYYTDEWSTTSDWGVEYHSFVVSVSDPCEAKYELTVFGSAGTLQTEEGVTASVTDYIQNHSIRKEVLVERTGREGEFGDGWGYKVFDWTSEYRMWRLVVPRLDVTTTATAARKQDSQYYGIVGNYSSYPSNPMLDYGLAPGSVTEGVSVTHGKTSPDRCTSADLTYSAWTLAGSGSDVVSAVAAGLTYGSSQYGFEIRECAIPSDAVYEIDLYVPGYYSNVSNVFHCTMTNFRPSGTSVTYDNTVHCWSWRNGTLFTEGEFTTHPSFGFSANRYSSNFKSVTVNAMKIADTVTAHYFYDPGMRCTWSVNVTNGCFFTSKVADGNLTAEGD